MKTTTKFVQNTNDISRSSTYMNLYSMKYRKGFYVYVSAPSFEEALEVLNDNGFAVNLLKSVTVVKRVRRIEDKIYYKENI